MGASMNLLCKSYYIMIRFCKFDKAFIYEINRKLKKRIA